MLANIFILVCVLAAVSAYPYADAEDSNDYEVYYEPVEYQRVRRQAPTQKPYQSPIQLSGGGGGNRKSGYNINIDAAAPVWKSNNGRHEVGVNGGYSQHLGGPYGNSKPDFRGGVGYTFRFG